VKAGSGVMTAGVPDSSGVPAGCTEDTLLAIYNDTESVEKLFNACGSEIAAVIVEPVGANMGVVPPAKGFLESLRKLCTENGSVLIFDEVITGFRLARAGAQEYFGIQADLVTYGKIIGGGMPVGAYGGKREIMEVVAPSGNVYQAGTLSGNPVAMAAGMAQLTYLNEHPEVYTELEQKGEQLYGGMEKICEELSLPWQVNHVSSLGCMFFTNEPVVDYTSAKTSDTEVFAGYFRHMIESGIYIAPSQFEAMFLSAVHTTEEIQFTLDTMHKYFEKQA
jgi:glutamate-1-semialdehyde 2,1-aminomutase